MRDIIFYGDKGLPSKPTMEQIWAIEKIEELNYRETFGLSKKEMEEEPIDDFIINKEILRLFQEKISKKTKKINKNGRY